MTNEERDRAMADIHAKTDEESVEEIHRALKADLDKNIKEMAERLEEVRRKNRMRKLFENKG